MKKVLITGGAGFAGHHVVDYLLKNTEHEVIILDKLNYASPGFDRFRDLDILKQNNRVKLLTGDLEHPISIGMKREMGAVN